MLCNYQAENCFVEGLGFEPHNVDAHQYLAALLRCRALSPANESGLNIQAEGERSRNIQELCDASVRHYQIAFSSRPDSYEIMNGLGLALLLTNRIDDAGNAFLDALGLLEPYASDEIRSEPNLAFSPTAGSMLDFSNEISSDRALLQMAHILTHLAASFIERGDVKKSIDALRIALRLRPDLGIAYYQMGRVMHARGKFKKAVTAYRTAVEIAPDNRDAYIGLGRALIEATYQKDATIALRTSIELGGGTTCTTNYGSYSHLKHVKETVPSFSPSSPIFPIFARPPFEFPKRARLCIYINQAIPFCYSGISMVHHSESSSHRCVV